MSRNDGPRRLVVDRRAAEDGWTVVTLECGHKCSVRSHRSLIAMSCWLCEDQEAASSQRPQETKP